MKRTTRHNENVELERRSLADLAHDLSLGDPDNLYLEGTNANDKASTPKARSLQLARAKDYVCRCFT